VGVFDVLLLSNWEPLRTIQINRGSVSSPARASRGLGTLLLHGPTTGRFLDSLKEGGIDAKDIETVVMTHAHVDHLGENNVDDGTSNLPYA
jgi:glyoxylase-like metal-dependent hydrolase (beta-lactamase superfamily II)